jgi:hypothetical protein
MTHLISTLVWALVAGILVACVIWRFSTKRRRALRAIDIVSYAIAILGFSSTLFALQHLDERTSDRFSRVEIAGEIMDILFDTGIKFTGSCSNMSKGDEHSGQCKAFQTYMNELVRIDMFNPSRLPPVSADQYTDPTIHGMAEEVSKAVNDTNEKISNRSSSTVFPLDRYDTEYSFLTQAISVLAFAFGMGLGRRGLDLYTDW